MSETNMDPQANSGIPAQPNRPPNPVQQYVPETVITPTNSTIQAPVAHLEPQIVEAVQHTPAIPTPEPAQKQNIAQASSTPATNTTEPSSKPISSFWKGLKVRLLRNPGTKLIIVTLIVLSAIGGFFVGASKSSDSPQSVRAPESSTTNSTPSEAGKYCYFGTGTAGPDSSAFTCTDDVKDCAANATCKEANADLLP